MPRTVVTVTCSWCRAVIETKYWTGDDAMGETAVSHTICDDCIAAKALEG